MHRLPASRLTRRPAPPTLPLASRALLVLATFALQTGASIAQPAVPWSKLPRMQLERQFAGPLQDTIIQRWRDPADGSVCYIYLPITAQHSSPTDSGYVQYGPNIIGTISCLEGPPPTERAPAPAGKKK